MKIEIRFELESQAETGTLLDQLRDEKQLSALAQVIDHLRQKLENVVCPIHDQPPHITIMVTPSGEVEPNIAGCCNTLINVANARFKKHLVQTAYFSPRMKLVLCLEDETEETFCYEVHEIDRLVIGRSDPSGSEPPDVDLQPYQAVEKGISRRHASIIWQNGALHVVDEESANGTFLNGMQLMPHQPQVLHNGDLIVLGSLILHVRFDFE